jgi:hypothetical protein
VTALPQQILANGDHKLPGLGAPDDASDLVVSAHTRCPELQLVAAPSHPPENTQLLEPVSVDLLDTTPVHATDTGCLFPDSADPVRVELHQLRNDYTLLLGWVQALEGSLRREGNFAVADRVLEAIETGTRKGAVL